MDKRIRLQLTLVAAARPWALAGAGAHAQEVLKIGVNGVMSGEAASWGLVNKYCGLRSRDGQPHD